MRKNVLILAVLVGVSLAGYAFSRPRLPGSSCSDSSVTQAESHGPGRQRLRNSWTCSSGSSESGASYIFLATFLQDGCVDGGLVPDAGVAGSFTRASAAYGTMSDGGLALCGVNERRHSATYGLYLEPASTNYLTNVQTLNVNWTQSGVTIAANNIAAPDGTTTAEKLTFNANGYISAGNSNITYPALEPSLWLKRSSTTGTISLHPYQGNTAYGNWTINLASLPDAWTFITRHHAAVTVVSEFAGEDALQCNACYDPMWCGGGSDPCCESGPPACTGCDCGGYEVLYTTYPGLKIISDATGRTVWAWNPQQEYLLGGARISSSSINATGSYVARAVDVVTYVPSYNWSAASGSFQITYERSSANSSTFQPIYLADVLNIRYGEGGSFWKITAGNTGAQTATSAAQTFSAGESDLIKWRYKVGDKACIQVNTEAEVCSAGNITTISSGALASGPAANFYNGYWLKRMVICPNNDGGCI